MNILLASGREGVYAVVSEFSQLMIQSKRGERIRAQWREGIGEGERGKNEKHESKKEQCYSLSGLMSCSRVA